MIPDLSELFDSLVTLSLIVLVFAVLGVWKAIELIVWLFSHVSVTVG